MSNPSIAQSCPPVVFPWEIFGSRGEFVKEDDFIFAKMASDKSEKKEARTLHRLVQGIWEGAKERVELATKISLVGLSMHPYLEDAFAYLFDGKPEGMIETVVVANQGNTAGQDYDNLKDSRNPCGRSMEVLKRVYPGLKCEPRPITSFEEFIKREMDYS